MTKVIDPSGPLRDQVPWLTFQAIAFLERWLTPVMSVHEWGCGGSTVFFAKRCKSVMSVDHAEPWVHAVNTKLAALELTNATVRLVSPDAEPRGNHLVPGDFSSSGIGKRMRTYCNTIKDEHDLVLVDGRARNGCVLVGSQHVKPGGMLVLDNAERRHYGQAVALMKQLGWDGFDWTGLSIYGAGASTTTFGWRRPA